MATETDITSHYSSGELLGRLSAVLSEDGADPNAPTIASMAPYDQFHGRGMEATEELAGVLDAGPGDHVLDVGCGIGGPARYMADRFGCRVTGIDLTPEFCDAARHVTGLMGLGDRVVFEQGDATAMPFGDAAFDKVYSMNVSMNISDKTGFYTEIGRVLKPGGRLILSEIAQGPGGDVEYPTPWARTAASSFLATPEETRAGLEACGFTVEGVRDTSEQVLEFGARSRALVEAGEKPLHRAVQLFHGDLASESMGNTSRGVAERRLIPIEILCHKKG